MHAARFAPQSDEREPPRRQSIGSRNPRARVESEPRPRLMAWESLAVGYEITESRHIILPEQTCHMLEPRNEWRRQIEPGHHYQRQMGVHRNIGCLGRCCASDRLAEGDAGQSEEQRAEGDQQSEYQDECQKRRMG